MRVVETDYSQPRRNWCLESEEFRNELLAAASERVGANHHGSESDRRETAEETARRIVSEGLSLMGWDSAALQSLPKGHKDKVWLVRALEQKPKGDPENTKIALRLRRETTMTLAWVAEQLLMGTTQLSHLLYWHGKKS